MNRRRFGFARLTAVSGILLLAILIQDSSDFGFPADGTATGRSKPIARTSAATNSNSPLQFLGQIGGKLGMMATHGNAVYVGIGQKLVTVDVSSPDHPV